MKIHVTEWSYNFTSATLHKENKEIRLTETHILTNVRKSPSSLPS